MTIRNIFNFTKRRASKLSIGVCAAMVVIAGPLQFSNSAYADRYDDQINAIKKQVEQLQGKAGELNQKANTLQAALDVLTAEKNTIQAQLNLSQAEYDKLKVDIEENKKKLSSNQAALGGIIADLYVDGKISPLEMLASSQNVGQYVDRQEYRTAASEKLNSTIETIKKLKKQLEEDQKRVELVLANQKNQRDALAAKEAEQQNLVNQTRGEEAVYNQMTAQKNSQIDALRSQQAAEIKSRASSGAGFTALPGDPNKGGYPAKWANAPMNAYIDTWGMYTRQCVSYAAFKVASTYGNMPYWGGRGNANQWDENAKAAGIPVSTVPKAGTVGVQNSQPYGHVVWVEAVNPNGTLTISQFNANWSGDYSKWIVDRSFLDVYIYFGG